MLAQLTLPDVIRVTYFVETSPSWEVKRLSASQVIPRILCNLKLHYRIHKCTQTVTILSQTDPVHNTTSHFLNTHLNINFPSFPSIPVCSM